jgi:aspartate ammonia-lyase
VKECLAKNRNLKDLLIEQGLFTQEELEIILSPSEFLKPGIPGWERLKKKNE